MGLYLDRPAQRIDPRGFSACNNVRVEFGRVNSSLLGWAPSAYPQLPGPCVHLACFVDSYQKQTLIAVTPTDIVFLEPGGTNYYGTPIANQGWATVVNGSAAVVGDGATRWNTDIQFGDIVNVLPAAVAAGSTKLYLQDGDLSGNNNGVASGVAVSDLTNGLAILPGTYLMFGGADSGGAYIMLSQATNAVIPNTDTLQLGNAIALRPQVRPGDQIYFGSYGYVAIAGPWYTVQSVNSDQSITLTTPYTGTSGTVRYTVRQLLTDTTKGPNPYLAQCTSANFPSAGGFNNTQTDTQGGDAWFFTNGIDPVVVFNSAEQASCQFARTLPFVCNALAQSRGIMVYGGLQIPGQSYAEASWIASSDNGFPLQLNSGVGFTGVAVDGPFAVSHLAVLGSVMMIYCTGPWNGTSETQGDSSGAVVSASFTGYPTIWSFSDVIKTRGPVCGGTVAEFPDRHQFLSIDGMYRYNGLFIQIMNDHIWRAVMKNFDTSRPFAAFCLQVPTYGDLIWATPLLSDPSGQLYANTAYVEHYMEQPNSYLFKPYTQRDFPFTDTVAFQAVAPATFGFLTGAFSTYSRTWNSFSTGGNQPDYYAGDYLGNIWQLYTGNKQNGVAKTSSVTWSARVLGTGRAQGLVKRIYPEIEPISPGPAGVTVTLTLQNAIGGPTVITDVQTFDATYAATSNRFTTHYRSGRVGAVTISDAAGLGWVCDGYDWDWVSRGLR